MGREPWNAGLQLRRAFSIQDKGTRLLEKLQSRRQLQGFVGLRDTILPNPLKNGLFNFIPCVPVPLLKCLVPLSAVCHFYGGPSVAVGGL